MRVLGLPARVLRDMSLVAEAFVTQLAGEGGVVMVLGAAGGRDAAGRARSCVVSGTALRPAAWGWWRSRIRADPNAGGLDAPGDPSGRGWGAAGASRAHLLRAGRPQEVDDLGVRVMGRVRPWHGFSGVVRPAL